MIEILSAVHPFRLIYIRYLDLKDEKAKLLEAGSGWDEPDTPSSHSDVTDGDDGSDDSDDYFKAMEAKFHKDEQNLKDSTFPVLGLLLEAFEHRPELVEEEDSLKTSPGTILHYFASFNYIRCHSKG